MSEEVVRFERVTKSFARHESRSVKDLVVGMTTRRSRRTQFTAVDELSFSIKSGETVGLLGHNGSGKSTTLKMLAGVIRPSSGLVRARGRVAPLLELGAGFHSDLTGRENIFLNGAVLGIPRFELQRKFDDIVDFAEMNEFIDTPLKFYSSGMVVRLGFAVAVNIEPDILLIDEVLAVGDAAFKEKSKARIAEYRAAGATIVLVTHNWTDVEEFCDRALVLDRGRLIAEGAVSEVKDAARVNSRTQSLTTGLARNDGSGGNRNGT